jgi:hypothetical protein
LTFKDLRKRLSLESSRQQYTFFGRLQDKPFWIWNKEEHKQEDIKQMEIAALTTLLVYQLKMQLVNHFMIMKK